MRYNRVNGFLSLGVILYLSTFPLGKALDDCSTLDEPCGDGEKECCPELTCFTLSASESKCLYCTNKDEECGASIPDCCDDLTCFTDGSNSTCTPCTKKNHDCGSNEPDCCYGSYCLIDGSKTPQCEKCGTETETCVSGKEADCCPHLTCFSDSTIPRAKSTCVPCTVQEEVCGLKTNCTEQYDVCGSGSTGLLRRFNMLHRL
eukprot:196144_1